ncbi:unnamed protein product, partial [Aphanomyces euteiches]
RDVEFQIEVKRQPAASDDVLIYDVVVAEAIKHEGLHSRKKQVLHGSLKRLSS